MSKSKLWKRKENDEGRKKKERKRKLRHLELEDIFQGAPTSSAARVEGISSL
jgi:hypothetical protein